MPIDLRQFYQQFAEQQAADKKRRLQAMATTPAPAGMDPRTLPAFNIPVNVTLEERMLPRTVNPDPLRAWNAAYVPEQKVAPQSAGLKDVEIGLRQGASDLVGMFTAPADKLYGGRTASGATLTEASQELLLPDPQEVAARQSLGSKIIQGASRAPVDLLRYGIATTATGGNPLAGMAAADMLTGVDAESTPADVLKAGAHGATLGAVLGKMGKYGRTTRVPVAAAIGGGLTAAEGGNASDVVASAVTMGALSGIHGKRSTKPAKARTDEPPGLLRDLLTSEEGASTMKRGWETFEDKWIDDLARVRRLDEKAWKLARDYAGHEGKIRGLMKDARRAFKPLWGDKAAAKDLDRYMELQRVEEDFQLKGPGYEAPGGMTLPQVQAELQGMAQRLGPRMGDIDLVARRLRQMNNNFLLDLRESGLLNQAGADWLTRPGHKYAPLQRLEYFLDKEGEVPSGGRSLNVLRQDVVREAEGSTKAVRSPVEAILYNMERMIALADKNRVGRRIAELANNPATAGAVRELRGNMKLAADEGAVTAWIDGTKHEYAVPKPVAEAMKGMTVSEGDLFRQWAGKIAGASRVMVAGSTRFNPPYWLTGLYRDVSAGYMNSLDQGFFAYPAQLAKGFWSALSHDAYFDRFLQSGASMSGFFERQGDVRKTVPHLMESQAQHIAREFLPHRAARRIGETFELGPRLAYLRMLEKANLTGKADIPLWEEGFRTRNSTTDFARAGTHGRALNLLTPLLNARKEGLVNQITAIKNNPGKAAMVYAAAVGVPTVAAYIHNTQNFPEVWEKIHEREKARATFWIRSDKFDKKTNRYTDVIRIPKNDLWAAATNILEASLEHARKNVPPAWGRVLTQVASDTLPVSFADGGRLSGSVLASGLLPPTAKAFAIEPLAGRNLFTDKPIDEEDEKQADPWMRRTIDTPEWLVSASKAIPKELNVSPKQLQNIASTQFGALGRRITEDRRKGRGPWYMERTGLGQIVRNFQGAQGGGQDEADFEMARPHTTAAANQAKQRKLTAQKLWRDTEDLPPEQRREVLVSAYRSGEMDLDVFEKYLNEGMDAVQGVAGFERWLRAQPLEARAPIIMEKFQKTPGAKKQELLERYLSIGVLTEDAFKAIVDRAVAAQSSAGRNPAPPSEEPPEAYLDRIMGVPAQPSESPEADMLDRIMGVK